MNVINNWVEFQYWDMNIKRDIYVKKIQIETIDV